MADNVAITPGSGATAAADDIGGVLHLGDLDAVMKLEDQIIEVKATIDKLKTLA